MTKNFDAGQDPITAAHEDYLRAIFLLLQRGEWPTNSAISGQLQVSPASATNMLKRLAELGLVFYTPYHGAELTEEGMQRALVVVRYHRLLELYLNQVLAMPWDQVHAEADRLEHVISANLAEALARALGDPRVDPHGDPIPGRDGVLPAIRGRPLVGYAPGDVLALTRVGAQDAADLHLLGELGLYPGASLVLRGPAPAQDALIVEVAGVECTLSRRLAESLLAEPRSREA